MRVQQRAHTFLRMERIVALPRLFVENQTWVRGTACEQHCRVGDEKSEIQGMTEIRVGMMGVNGETALDNERMENVEGIY
jgi:hypothetical protein